MIRAKDQYENANDRTAWDYQTVTLSRVPGFGFGIAVSGGKDNPHFANGDPSIAVSDVLASGPAEDKLQVNDRIITVNGISLENVEYATAVQVLRDSGNTVTLVVKRRIPQASNGQMMSPSHQHSHSLSSAGLISNGAGSQPQIKVVITKGNKKDDFGIVLGCKLFVKEISSKTKEQLSANGYTLQEGDVITRIHNANCNDSMSIKEAKKVIDSCKDRLTISVVRGDVTTTNLNSNSGMQSPAYSHTAQVSNCSNIDDNFLSGGPSYSAQNLYVQPPTRTGNPMIDDKSNLTPRGRSRNPLTDISLQQLDRPSTPTGGINHQRSRSGIDQELPRPPMPRNEDYYSSRRQLYDEDQSLMRNKPSEPRYITFQKEGSVGIRLTGGNEVGIFVTAVQQGSPASMQGLVPGDKILKVNDMDMNGVTREEAVLFLLSLQDRIDLIVQYCKEEYDNVIATQRGDSFHIKTHFHYDTPSKGETPFKAGDVFRVVDTLYNGVVGAWQVIKVGRGHTETQRGVIPNKARAEELATAQFNATKKEISDSQSRVGFFRRRRTNHRRSKSLSRENWDDVVFSDSISKFPAYERVVLRHPGFVRPVCLFGATSDIARDRLMKECPDKFTAPLQDDDKGSKCGIVRLSNIRDIMDRGKHALLDITPNAVDRLNYAQFYPVVIFLKADNKHVIKQLRQGVPKSAHKSSKKLLEQCQKLEKVWSHVFSATIMLGEGDQWYRKLRDMIDQQQSGAVWMSETKRFDFTLETYLPYNYTPYSPQQQPCLLPCCNPIYSPTNAFNINNNNTFRSPSRSLRYSLPPQQTYQVVPIRQARRPLINQFSDSLPQLYDYNNVIQMRSFGRQNEQQPPLIPPIPQNFNNNNNNKTFSYLNQNPSTTTNNNTLESRRSPYYYNDLATLRIGEMPDSNRNLKYFPTNRYEPRIDINEFEFENNNNNQNDIENEAQFKNPRY
uniref:CSON015359 protein n=1 Tax=Culicoides sonorensis TaxID=179676 RepID=A0A336ME51_CULSO